MAPPIPRILPVPECSGSPIVDGGPRSDSVQVRDGSYPANGGKSSGEVSDISMTIEAPKRGGGLRLY